MFRKSRKHYVRKHVHKCKHSFGPHYNNTLYSTSVICKVKEKSYLSILKCKMSLSTVWKMWTGTCLIDVLFNLIKRLTSGFVHFKLSKQWKMTSYILSWLTYVVLFVQCFFYPIKRFNFVVNFDNNQPSIWDQNTS